MNIFQSTNDFPYKTSTQCQQQLSEIEAIDYFFAIQVLNACNKTELPKSRDEIEQIFHVLLALSDSLRQGSLCLPLDQIAGQLKWHEKDLSQANVLKQGFTFYKEEELEVLLQHLLEALPSESFLIFRNKCLYSKRYWQYENDLCDFIAQSLHHDVVNKRQNLIKQEVSLLNMVMSDLFKLAIFEDDQLQWQQLAALNTLYSPFSILTGGAGTGKTYTITRIAVLLCMVLHIPPQRIEMVAPTGKAANKMLSSLQKELHILMNEDIDSSVLATCKQLCSITPKTINSLLKTDPLTGIPAFSENNTLPAKVVIVDEASMIDISLMNKLIKSINTDCQLLLVGDPNQLPSVENGCLLADLVAHSSAQFTQKRWNVILQDFKSLHKADAFAKTVLLKDQQATEQVSAKGMSFVNRLYESRRSNAVINAFAKSILDGNAEQALSIAKQSDGLIKMINVFSKYTDNDVLLSVNKVNQWWLEELIQTHILLKYSPLFAANSPQQAFDAMQAYALLTPYRKSIFGVVQLNQTIEKLLAKMYSHVRVNQHYNGKPIMIMKNDYKLSLFNGDVGLIWQQSAIDTKGFGDPRTKYVACFQTAEGIVTHPIYNLPQYELNYAMTVHKTQGSEFSDVDFLLPEGNTQFLNRQLVYTAVTRAKKQLRLLSHEQIFSRAASSSAQRISGIEDTLSRALSRK